MEVQLKLNPATMQEFEKTLERYAQETRQTMRDVQLEQGALLARDSAIFTPPVVKGGGKGLGKSAFKAGLKSVEKDVRKIFVAQNDKSQRAAISIFTRRLAAATKANDIAAFNQVISSASLPALKSINGILRKILADPNYDRAFKKAKNFFGRVTTQMDEYGNQRMVMNLKPIHEAIRGRYNGRVRRNKGPGFGYENRYIVYGDDLIQDYVQKRQLHVGLLKSGWYGSIMSLPKPVINGVPKNFGVNAFNGADWVRRHGVGNGYSKLTQIPGGWSLKIGNRIADENNVSSDVEGGGVPAIALGNRVKQMIPRIAHLIQKAVDRANRKK